MSNYNYLVRTISDLFSKEHCDRKKAIDYAIKSTEGKCLYCGEILFKINSNGEYKKHCDYHLDHIYPASKLNFFEVGNIAITCSECNWSKNNIMPIEYYNARFYLKKQTLLKNEEEFSLFLDEMTKPYQEKWPQQYMFNFQEMSNEKMKIKMAELIFSIDFKMKKTEKRNIFKEAFDVDNIKISNSYLNRPLTAGEKLNLAEGLHILDHLGRVRKWPTIKKYLINSGYEIKDKTINIDNKGTRVSIITVKE